MKAIRILTIILISVLIGFTGCTEDEPELSKAEINKNILNDILAENTIKLVHVYEYSYATGEWNLAAYNQTYTEGMDLCHVEGTYFYLKGNSSYYFNLEYLVSFELGSDLGNDELNLYFKY